MKLTLNLGNMRSYAVAVVAGVLLLAGYSQKGEAAACAGTGTFQDLLTAQSCTIGDKTFSAFSTLGDLLASEIKYQAINGVDLNPGPGSEKQWGFLFQFNLFASGAGEGDPQSSDQSIAYTVACTNGSLCIDSIHAKIVGSIASTEDPETGFEDFLGGFLTLGENYSGTSFELALPTGPATYDANFTPVSSLRISKDLNATCADIGTSGEPNDACVASFSFMENTVDQTGGGGPGDDDDDTTVPEPASLLLLATGLLGLGWSRRSRRNQM